MLTKFWGQIATAPDVNLDGRADFQLASSVGGSAAGTYHRLFIESLDSFAYFGVFRQHYEVCKLLNGPTPEYFSIDCRPSCSDYSADEIGENQITVFETGFFDTTEGLEQDATFKDDLRWRQNKLSFKRPSYPILGNLRNCALEVTFNKWGPSRASFIPIKLIDEEGMVKLGWIKFKHSSWSNYCYESYIQAY